MHKLIIISGKQSFSCFMEQKIIYGGQARGTAKIGKAEEKKIANLNQRLSIFFLYAPLEFYCLGFIHF